jgi:hypothetical protein
VSFSIRRLAWLLIVVLVDTVSSTAQGYPIVEFSGGISYAHANIGSSADMIGWHITFGMNPARSLRLLGDFSEQQVQSSAIIYNGERSTIKDYEYVWGPQFVYRRNPRVAPFAHALIGVAARHYTAPSNTPGGPDVFAHDFGFASVFGGGVDINVARMVAIRIMQVDVSLEHRNWVDAQFTPSIAQLPASGNWQARPRIACGIVIKVGSRGNAR